MIHYVTNIYRIRNKNKSNLLRVWITNYFLYLSFIFVKFWHNAASRTNESLCRLLVQKNREWTKKYKPCRVTLLVNILYEI